MRRIKKKLLKHKSKGIIIGKKLQKKSDQAAFELSHENYLDLTEKGQAILKRQSSYYISQINRINSEHLEEIKYLREDYRRHRQADKDEYKIKISDIDKDFSNKLTIIKTEIKTIHNDKLALLQAEQEKAVTSIQESVREKQAWEHERTILKNTVDEVLKSFSTKSIFMEFFQKGIAYFESAKSSFNDIDSDLTSSINRVEKKGAGSKRLRR